MKISLEPPLQHDQYKTVILSEQVFIISPQREYTIQITSGDSRRKLSPIEGIYKSTGIPMPKLEKKQKKNRIVNPTVYRTIVGRNMALALKRGHNS